MNKTNDGVNIGDVKPCIMYRVGNLIDRQDAAASDVGLCFSVRRSSFAWFVVVVGNYLCVSLGWFQRVRSISHQTIDNNNLSVVSSIDPWEFFHAQTHQSFTFRSTFLLFHVHTMCEGKVLKSNREYSLGASGFDRSSSFVWRLQCCAQNIGLLFHFVSWGDWQTQLKIYFVKRSIIIWSNMLLEDHFHTHFFYSKCVVHTVQQWTNNYVCV